jgi:hypothetical protein
VVRRLVGGLLLVLALVGAASAQLGVPRVPAPLAFSPVTVLPMATRAGGTYNFGPVTIPTGVVGAQAMMDVNQATDPLPAITTILEGSVDGGTTWMSAGSFERTAGPKGLNRLGQPLTELGAKFFGGPVWDDAANGQRRLRGIATLGGSMRFALVVTPQ